MSNTPDDDALLTDLCTICHINPPKYCCPRCSTRTCSLPCSRRHKLWSQCSGVRDPAAYLRRNELATPAAFDRDFNFITGIERTIERAERDVENRGVTLDRTAVEENDGDGGGGPSVKKRKRGPEPFVKGEAGFLRGAETAGVVVVRAPKGMTRSRLNLSRWNTKHKCLTWTIEWVTMDGKKTTKNHTEACTLTEAYDRFNPIPKQDKPTTSQDRDLNQEQNQSQKPAPPSDEAESRSSGQEQPPPDAQPEEIPPVTTEETAPQDQQQSTAILSHRDIYFYLHRPRTITKQPVLIPLSPSSTLTAALRGRTVLEFPTIYILPDSPETLRAEKESEKEGGRRFILEEDYLAEHPTAEERGENLLIEKGEEVGDGEPSSSLTNAAAIDLGEVDEKKVLEVLKQDLFEPVPDGAL